MTCTATLDQPDKRAAKRGFLPGAVAGAVLRAARLSAGLTEARLAIAAGLPLKTIREWEEGSSPLAAVPLAEVERLEAALRKTGADPRVVADFTTAAWCDLVILAMINDEDTSCLMADPISRDVAFGELLLWSLAGHIPPRYQPYTTMLHRPPHLPRATD
ncbi:MAG: helix-turn-helix domain-containing protein [Streptosporangiaceae bacterium]